MFPGALGPSGGSLNKREVGEEEEEEEAVQSGQWESDTACGSWEQKTFLKEKCNVHQNKQVVSHRQENVNSNTIG